MKKRFMWLSVFIAAAICCFTLANTMLAQTPAVNVVMIEPVVKVDARLRTTTEHEVTLEIAVKNLGAASAYIVADTQRVNSSRGPYLDTDSTDPAKLMCSFQFYPPNPFHPFRDDTSARLLEMAPGESHDEIIRLHWPLRTTEPPFQKAPGTKELSALSIKRIEVLVGVFPSSPSLTNLIKLKPAPHDAYSGLEQVNTSLGKKALYELQSIVRSNVVEITN